MPTAANYNPSNNPNSLVFDSSLRTISNLIVDQTLGNPAAILKGLQAGGVVDASLANVALVQAIYAAFKPALDAEYQARVVMQNAKTAANALSDGDPTTPPSAAEQAALDVLATATAAHAVTLADSGSRPRGPRCGPRAVRHHDGRRQRPDHQRLPGRRPVGPVQLLVHAVRPVLRSRSRSRQQGRQRHRVRSASAGRSAVRRRAATPTSWC